MKMKKISVDVYELTEGKNAGFRYLGTEEEEYPDDGRRWEICSICGLSAYPDCMEFCHNAKIEREKEAKAQKS